MADPFESLLVRFTPPRGGQVLTVPPPSDLRFDAEWSGGAKSLSCTLVLPGGTALPTALARFSLVDVVDRRTGRIVWHGRLTDPGLTVLQGGLQCSVTAEGSQMVTDGWREVYGLVDRGRGSWQPVGEFDPAQGGFGGNLAPGDLDLGDFDLGDYGDMIGIGDLDLGGFGGELGIDFAGDLDLGGDLDIGDLLDLGGFGGGLGDFGGIDFTGGDYPAPADFPGYLGYLQDPLGDLGDMLAIPMGGDPPDLWTGGYGTGAVSIPGGVRLTGGTGRHLTPPLGQMILGPGYYEGYYDGEGDLVIGAFGGEPNGLNTAIVDVMLVDSSSSAHLWIYADYGLSNDGWRLDIDVSGTLTIYSVAAGVATLLESFSKTLTAGLTYQFRIWTGNGLQYGIYDPGSFPVEGDITDTNWPIYQNDCTPELYAEDLVDSMEAASTRCFGVAAVTGEVEFTNYRGFRYPGPVIEEA